MNAEQLPSLDEVASSVGAARQRLSDSDLVGASRSALTSARDAIPEGWPGHRQRRRWPWVAGIILAVTALGVIVFGTGFRRSASLARLRNDSRGRHAQRTDFSPADQASIVAHPALSDPSGTLPLAADE